MSNNIIVDVSFGQTRVAVVEDGELVELYIEDSEHTSMVGNIYLGKVVNVFPGMEAAFVDIGQEKNAFLYVGDAIIRNEFKEDSKEEAVTPSVSINDVVKVGQDILVQVVKEPIGTKGPRVTANITLPGRYAVLVPNVDYIGISRRIEDEDEKQRLKTEIEKVKPEGFGMIIRTAAEGLTESHFAEDINFLTKLWSKIKAKSEGVSAPRVIHRDLSLVYRTVRDMFTQSIDKFVINEKEEYTKVLELVELISPGLKTRVEYYSKSHDIFEYYQIQSKISKALARKVWLKSGGYIVIDQTEALIVIDVNTGKYVGNNNLEETILKINLEAAKEIAKQLRLRDIGGIIIIDFIDMMELEHQTKVLDALRQHLKKDKTRTHIIGFSQLGLVEMTRKKMRQNLSLVLQTECPCCSGSGKILLPEMIAKDIERKIDKLFCELMAEGVIVEAHHLVIKELEGEAEEKLNAMKNKYNKTIILKTKRTQNIEEFEVKDVDNIKFLC